MVSSASSMSTRAFTRFGVGRFASWLTLPFAAPLALSCAGALPPPASATAGDGGDRPIVGEAESEAEEFRARPHAFWFERPIPAQAADYDASTGETKLRARIVEGASLDIGGHAKTSCGHDLEVLRRDGDTITFRVFTAGFEFQPDSICGKGRLTAALPWCRGWPQTFPKSILRR